MHTAAFASAGLDWTYALCDVDVRGKQVSPPAPFRRVTTGSRWEVTTEVKITCQSGHLTVDRDFVAEVAELVKELAGALLWGTGDEPVGSEILVGNAAFQHVVDSDQDRMLDGNCGLRPTPTATQPFVLGRQVGPLALGGCLG